MWRSNFTIALGCCFEMSAFTELGKAISSFVQQKIIESWLEWKGPSQIGREQTKPLPRLLIFSFAEGISKTTNEELSLSQRVLNDLNNYMECCKTTNPSIYSSEIQNKLVENNIPVLAQKCPISCIDQPQHNIINNKKNLFIPRKFNYAVFKCTTKDLGLYSFKKSSVIPQESPTLENENILFYYLAACNTFL